MTTARRLILNEFRTERGVELSIDEREALRALHPGIKVEPTPYLKDRYDLTPDQRIGIVSLPSVVVEIRPKVPMSSVLFLMSYACDALTWFERRPELGEGADLVEVVGIMLARLVEQATRRGLLNGYQTEDDALRAPRGRILFDEQLRRRCAISPPIEVRYDNFTPDVIENRLLVAALSVVTRMPLRSETARRELGRARQLFGGVAQISFHSAAVPEVRFTRLNRHYHAAIALATLVLRSASLDLGRGSARGSALLVDMNVVFERFVRTALRDALGAEVRKFPDRGPALRLDEAGLVPLKPDLCLVEANRVSWVGDVKYKRLPAEAYRNADLYQLLAYSVALDLPGGTLIYAADEGIAAAEHLVVRVGKRLRVVALDLRAPVSAVLRQVERVAQEIRSAVLTKAS